MGSIRLYKHLAIASILVGGLLPLVAEAAPEAKQVFCCNDSQKKPACGDVLPMACYGRAYWIVTPQGTVLKRVDAPLTPEELARVQAEKTRVHQESVRSTLQRRLDQALLETYQSAEEIDRREQRALTDSVQREEDLQAKLSGLHKRRIELSEEESSFQPKEIPQQLINRIKSIERELAVYQDALGKIEAEQEAIRKRYAKDRARYNELVNAAGLSTQN